MDHTEKELLERSLVKTGLEPVVPRRGRRVFRIHQEDACQFLDLYPSDKYRVTTRRIAEGILEAAVSPSGSTDTCAGP